MRSGDAPNVANATLTAALFHRKSLVDEVFPTCVYTVALLGRGI
ncbi:MAG: hypothetical protein V7K21_28780 [Nostoc sp.]